MHHTMEVNLRTSMHVKKVLTRVRVICEKIHSPHPLGIFYGENPFDYSFSLILFEIILIISISRIIRILLKPLRQPRIISDILVSYSYIYIYIKMETYTFKLYFVCLTLLAKFIPRVV